MTRVVLVLFVWFQMQVINILSHQGHLPTQGVEDLCEGIDENVDAVGFELSRHFVDLVNPLPDCLRMLVKKWFCDEFFRLVFFALPFKLFWIEAILSAKCGYSTGSRDSGSRYEQDLFMTQHGLDNFSNWPCSWQMLVLFPFFFSWLQHEYFNGFPPQAPDSFSANLFITSPKLALKLSIFL